ncbi:hypothetical protein CFK37_11035 [Virgibacillus phasianinus]|uniref:CidA/LrgA family protein n=1 Tax=Virgibacillus phasianinus TaxID=2017483 RepID=A0A220U3H9_9BACI|nr:CidA/LrgA family holin-like protein [Virgibacillus phasianinus]ASK62647.1 hypothetical protein CFK37_11035 [Virgibacillus phasianinus]
MKIIRIISQIALLYLIFLFGEGLHNILHIPLPGSIIGLLLLLAGLSCKIIPIKLMEDGAGFILKYLPLFFIPATIGIMKYPSLLSWSGVVLLLIVVVSTIITMVTAGTISQFFERQKLKRKEEQECSKRYTQSL